MSNELTATGPSGLTLSARLLLAGSAVGTAITMTESAVPGVYFGSVPAGTAAGFYLVAFLNGGTVVCSGDIRWDGTAEAPQPVNTTKIAGVVVSGSGVKATPWVGLP